MAREGRIAMEPIIFLLCNYIINVLPRLYMEYVHGFDQNEKDFTKKMEIKSFGTKKFQIGLNFDVLKFHFKISF